MRLQTQHLVNGSLTLPEEIVRHMLAMQAQNFGASQWAVGIRLPGSTTKSVVAAFDSGKIVRSWPMRGTLHLIDPQDLRQILTVTWPRMLQGLATRHRQLELDEKTLKQARKIAEEKLQGGQRSTRKQMLEAFASNGLEVDNQRGPHMIGYLAQEGVVCWGPLQGKEQLLVLLDEWAPPLQTTFDRDESLGALALRYFSSHGPATVKDFAWWTKMTLTDVRRGIEVAKHDLVELQSNDTSYWMSAEAHDLVQPDLALAKQSVLALPAFDEHLLGYQNRLSVLPSEYADRIVPGNNGMFLPTIVSGGQVVGTWRKSAKNVEATWFDTATKREEKDFAASAQDCQAFVQS